MQERIDRLSVGTEKTAEAEVDTCDHAVDGISAQILSSQAHHCFDIVSVFHKEGNNPWGQRLAEGENNCSESRTDHTAYAQHLPAPVMPAGSRILGTESRYGGKHGAGYKEEETDDFFHNSDCCRDFHAPAVGDHGDHQERDLDQSLLQGNRKADPQDISGVLPVRTKRFGKGVAVIFFQGDHTQKD